MFISYLTSPWENPTAWQDKLIWVKKYLNKNAYKRLILSHNKHLNKWDFLVDDRLANWADKFEWELIQFWTEKFPDWITIKDYLIKKNS